MSRRLVFKIISAVYVLVLAVQGVQAADLKISYKAEITSADPHVLNGHNRNMWMHVYEALVTQDETLRAKPSLAISWRNIDSTAWEFKLRPTVGFHNGAPPTSEEVKFSIERAMRLSGSRTFRTYPDSLSLIAVVSKSIGEKASNEDFATGKSALDTGPYKFVSWTHGQRVTLAKYNTYWGEREPWDNVIFQFIPRDPARASALLSGSLDLIDSATANVMDSFKASKKIDIASSLRTC